MIIEKAYAKMHFCWDAIDGGWSRQALEDLTGGLAYTLNLYKQDRETLGGPNYKGFMELANDPYIVLGCSVGWHVADAAGAGRAGEQVPPSLPSSLPSSAGALVANAGWQRQLSGCKRPDP